MDEGRQMSDTPTQAEFASDGKPIAEAIAFFDGILQSMPDDRVALEALSLACEQAGDIPRARAALIRLAQLVVRKGEREHAVAVARRLERYVAEDFDALEALRSIETLLAAEPEEAAAPLSPPRSEQDAAAAPLSDVALLRQVLSREMDLAWELLQGQQLNQEEYAALVEDLTRLSADERHHTVSLLHALADRGLPGFDRVLLYLAKRSGRPVIALSAFEPQRQVCATLPLAYAMRQGALPFDTIGEDLMVAVLNPLDAGLPTELERRLGHKCHCYLVTPADFDALCEKLRAAGGEEGAA
jgi:hypothetical protein